MDLQQIVSNLNNVKKSNGAYIAKCPGHDDKVNSLSISQGADGKTLLYCHAGCTPEHITASMGLKMSDLWPECPQEKKRIAAEYEYKDLNGQVIHKTIRYEPKSFSQCRPDGKGGWIFNLKDIRTVLYNLAEVTEAIQQGQTVYIVEGEKDCDNLKKIGLVATTSPMGAGKWRPHYSDYLINAIVVIIPDNDEPGKIHTEQVAKSLTGKAKSSKIINLPGLQDKQDITDFFRMNGKEKGMKTLNQLIQDGPEFRINDKKTNITDLLTTPDLDKKIKPIEWVIPNMAAKGDVTLAIGQQKGGKSWLWLRASCELSTGGRFMDGLVTIQSQKVLYLMYDNVGEGRVMERIRKAGWSFNPDNLRFVFNENIMRQGFSMQLDEQNSVFDQLIELFNPEIVIIDTLGSSHSRNENKNEEMKPILDKLINIARNRDLAMVILHHTRKRKSVDQGVPMTMDDAVGAGIMLRLASCIIGVEKKISETDDPVHIVKSLGSWYREFSPFEFSLIDETDENGREWLRMPINLNAGIDKNSQEAILRVINCNYWTGETFTRMDIVKRAKLSHETVSTVLNRLVIDGTLVSEGKTKSKTFRLPIRASKGGI